jgi:hypothetical protein
MATPAAAEAGVMAQVVSLKRDARAALDLGRSARSAELYERALAAAEKALPPDSVVTAALLYMASNARTTARLQEAASSSGGAVCGGLHPSDVPQLSTDEMVATVETMLVAWRTEHVALAQSQRYLALLLGRYSARTLMAPSAQECAFFEVASADADAMAAKSAALEIFFGAASDAVLYWPPLAERADEEARLRGVHGALCALMEQMPQCRGAQHAPRSGPPLALDPTSVHALCTMLDVVLLGKCGDMALQQALRATCGLSQRDVEALQVVAVVFRVKYLGQSLEDVTRMFDDVTRRAAADVARHGLRPCALPGCGATEASPKAFKVCGRCRAAAYCCAEHQREDWRRHKREERCAPPGGAAAAEA